jgi:hypothetical protein
MKMRTVYALGLAGLLLSVAAPGQASPITWTFAGLTNGSQIDQIPVGSPFTMSVFLDSSAPNACPAGYPMGVYSGAGGVLTVESAVAGTLVYTASSSLLYSGTLESVGCSPIAAPPPGPGAVELRMGAWSGPSFSNAIFQSVIGGPSPGLFWFIPGGTNGDFPMDQPLAPYFDGPYYNVAAGSRAITSFTSVRPIPEPALLFLFAGGLATVGVGRWRKRRMINVRMP